MNWSKTSNRYDCTVSGSSGQPTLSPRLSLLRDPMISLLSRFSRQPRKSDISAAVRSGRSSHSEIGPARTGNLLGSIPRVPGIGFPDLTGGEDARSLLKQLRSWAGSDIRDPFRRR
eukprot:745642-Hanusia_phi.AAC.1